MEVIVWVLYHEAWMNLPKLFEKLDIESIRKEAFKKSPAVN
jgi:hypothetical protein